jgi:HEAT repeat protein
MTLEEVRDALGATEPDYVKLAQELGADVLPILKEVIASGDVRAASKAVYLAAMIKSPLSVDILLEAATQPQERIRVAVSAAALDLDLRDAARVLARSLKDMDGMVRAVATRSVEASTSLKALIKLFD